jgi:hypothetical protein
VPTPPPAPEPGTWVAGGDPGVSWTASASSQYQSCAEYDLCNYSYAVDGTSAGKGTAGQTMALDGPKLAPSPYSQWVQVDFGARLAISRWRLKSGIVDSFAAENAVLEVGSAAVRGSTIANDPKGAGFAVSAPFAPVSASTVRVAIPGEWPSSSLESPNQLYVNEIQFFVAHAPPTPPPTPVPPTPPPTLAKCVGASRDLPQSQCDAWTELYDSTGGEAWLCCDGTRVDPCACQGSGGASPTCDVDNSTVITM